MASYRSRDIHGGRYHTPVVNHLFTTCQNKYRVEEVREKRGETRDGERVKEKKEREEREKREERREKRV